jgi:hypothetical protein
MTFFTQDNMLDYISADNYRQSLFDLFIQYDLSSSFSVLSDRDLLFIIEQLGRLIPAYARSTIVTNPIIEDFVAIQEAVTVAAA